MSNRMKIAGSIVGIIMLEAVTFEFWIRLPAFSEAVLLVLCFFGIVWTGSKHAYFYSLQRTAPARMQGRHEWVYRNLDAHKTQQYGELILFGLLILAGCDVLRVLGAQFMARLIFQGLINWSVGKPFVDPDEPRTWAKTNADGTVVIVRKFLPGRWSLLKPVIGAALIWVSILIR